MRIIVLATEDYLGAGKAAFRIYEALKESGHEICFIVKTKTSKNDPDILALEELVPPKKESLFTLIFKKLTGKFSKKVKVNPEYYFFSIDDNKIRIDINTFVKNLPFTPEIIIVTWISRFFNPRMIYELSKKTGGKVVYIPLDMSLLTGGCHYAWDCKGYETNCGNCPAILTNPLKVVAVNNLKDKLDYFDKVNSVVIAGTDQLKKQILSSHLFRNSSIEKILLPIDGNTFNDNSRNFAKSLLDINIQKKVVFFGASFSNEKRKGIDIFINILSKLFNNINAEQREKILILIVGKHTANENFKKVIPFEVCSFDYVNDDEKLSLIYQASDVFVCTSIQDSGPMMVNEAVMCGTPVVMHNLGVANDLIIDGVSGKKVEIGSNDVFAEAILYFLDLEARNKIDNKLIARNASIQTNYLNFSKKFVSKINK